MTADVQSAAEISDDGLTRAFTHMSIRCNPGAPKDVTNVPKPERARAMPDAASLRAFSL